MEMSIQFNSYTLPTSFLFLSPRYSDQPPAVLRSVLHSPLIGYMRNFFIYKNLASYFWNRAFPEMILISNSLI